MKKGLKKKGIVNLLIALLAQAAVDLFGSSDAERERSAQFFLSRRFREYLDYLEGTCGGLTPGRVIGLDRLEIRECAESIILYGRPPERYRSRVFESPGVKYLLGIKETKFPLVMGEDGTVIKVRKTLKEKVQMGLFGVK